MGFVVKAVKSVVKAVVGVVKVVAFGLIGLLMPKGNAKNKATESRLNKRLEPEDFRKIVFGETAGATDLRYWEAYNTTKYDEVLAAAGHKIEAFGALYIEEELVPFSGNNATGTYAGVLTRTTKLGTNPQTALSVGAGTAWDANSKFTGVAHYALKWTIDEKKLPGGIPSRYTQVIKGALMYDPRRDSTRGGTGTHRANDQSTWAYATVDGNGIPIGRNNALQMLWYLIGWRENGVLVAGRGVDLDDINFADFITAANDAEALSYYTDMILSTGDAHEQNESIISADGLLGEVLDPGGRWTYKIVKDDTADIVVDLGEDDVLQGEVSWVPEAKLSEKFNEVAGTYIDPSAASLYQDKAYPTVKDATYVTADGYRKRVSHNFQNVQNASLAQKLARIKLNRNRFTGEFTATFNLRALKAEIWSIVRLSVSRYGFNQKLFRVVGQSITEQGIDLVLREEDPSIYAGGTVTVPAAPSSSPSKYDTRQTVALTSLALTAAGLTGLNGSVQPGLRLTWAAVPSNVRRIEVEYKPTAVANWASAGHIGPDLTSVDVGGLLSATAYDFRARTWTIHEVPNAWQTVSATSPTGKVGWAEVSATSGAPETGATRNVNRGAWAQPVAYIVGDFVQSGGSSYSCLVAHTSAPATVPPHANWSLMAQAGTIGADGQNQATVRIFKRAASAPALPTTTGTYTYATGVITGLDNGWATAPQVVDGNPLYTSQAVAKSAGATDTIAAGEWIAAVVFVQDGTTPLSATALPNSIQVPCSPAWAPLGAIPGFQITVKQGTTDISAMVSYGAISYSSMSGASVDSDGTVSGTIVMSANSGWIEVPITYAGLSTSVRVNYTKLRDSSAYTSQTDSSISIPSSTSYVASNGGPITVAVGAGGTISLSASVTYDVAVGGATLTCRLAGKIRYRTTPGSGSWIDVAAETLGTTAISETDTGQLDISTTMAGPGSGTNWEFDLVLRRYSGTAYPVSQSGSLHTSWSG